MTRPQTLPVTSSPFDCLPLPPGRLPSWLVPDPDLSSTGPSAVYDAARRYVEAGLSVIPIAADGSKSPDHERLPRVFDEVEQRSKVTWKLFQFRRPTLEELERWRDFGGYFGLAAVAGAVSGGRPGLGLEILDFDTIVLAQPWAELVEQQAAGLVGRLAHVQSPRPGLHVYFRCSTFGGNQKLACAPEKDEQGQLVLDLKTGKAHKKTLIELKGEGGYCLVPPSPRFCHPRCKKYEFVYDKPNLLNVPVISLEERAILLDTARSFNLWQEPEKARPASKASASTGGRPGDDFNQRAQWSDILAPHGWTLVSCSGGIEYWRRPGKSEGHSATVNFADLDRLHVFSSNASPFEDEGTYNKFTAHALLNHGGDFRAAARDLLQQGYGSVSTADQAPASDLAIQSTSF